MALGAKGSSVTTYGYITPSPLAPKFHANCSGDILQNSLETFQGASKPPKINLGSASLKSFVLRFTISLFLKSVSSSLHGFRGQGGRWLCYAIPLGPHNHANCSRHPSKLVTDLSGGFKTTKDQSWKLLLEKLGFEIFSFLVF